MLLHSLKKLHLLVLTFYRYLLKLLLYILYRMDKWNYMHCTNRQFFACIIFMGRYYLLSL